MRRRSTLHASSHDSALRRIVCQALADREHRPDRGELRGLDLLRASEPPVGGVPCVLLSVHRRRILSRPGAVGHQLDHFDVPARELGSHPRQHDLPLRLRQERRGRVRSPQVPGVLLRRRIRGDGGAGGHDTAVRHRAREPRPEPRGERRDRCGPRGLLRALPQLHCPRARRDLPRQAFGLVLPRVLVPLPARRGELRALRREGERRRRGVLRPRRRVPVRRPRGLRAHDRPAGSRRRTTASLRPPDGGGA